MFLRALLFIWLASSNGPSETILATKKIVVRATSTQVITVCTMCVQTTGPGFMLISKTSSSMAIRVIKTSVISYVPDGKLIVYYGDSTKTVIENVYKCIAFLAIVSSGSTGHGKLILMLSSDAAARKSPSLAIGTQSIFSAGNSPSQPSVISQSYECWSNYVLVTELLCWL